MNDTPFLECINFYYYSTLKKEGKKRKIYRSFATHAKIVFIIPIFATPVKKFHNSPLSRAIYDLLPIFAHDSKFEEKQPRISNVLSASVEKIKKVGQKWRKI